MTEEEAKTCWCPFARDSETAGNRSAQMPDDIRFPCIASACMAWRWHNMPEHDWSKDRPEGEGWVYMQAIGGVAHWSRSAETKSGFCGLAGAPQ